MALFIQTNIPDQHFGQVRNLDDLILSLCGVHPSMLSAPCSRHKRVAPQSAPIPSKPGVGSQMSLDRHNFKVCVDVQHFLPEEISVKAVGNEIVVEGKHEDKQDEYGSISRHFVRRYALPEGHKSEDVVTSLSADGTLTITAPRREVPATEERIVPITLTGSLCQAAPAGGPTDKTPPQEQQPDAAKA